MPRDGHTVLLTTHYIEEAEQLCDRIAIIDHGRIIAVGAPGDLIAKSSSMQTVSLRTMPAVEAAWLSSVAGVEDVSVEGGQARFRTAHVHRNVAGVLGGLEARQIDVTELHVQKASLEDVFLELTGSSLRS